MKNIFPTFEEIYQGYCVYLLHDYKGLDDDGNPKYSEKLDMEVRIANNKYSELGLKVLALEIENGILQDFVLKLLAISMLIILSTVKKVGKPVLIKLKLF